MATTVAWVATVKSRHAKLHAGILQHICCWCFANYMCVSQVSNALLLEGQNLFVIFHS